ncbi:MAG TPA: hypothetical protein GX507_08260 [Clostridia bacterium]|nr:hypothetical protein [Clostridia bacterium]
MRTSFPSNPAHRLPFLTLIYGLIGKIQVLAGAGRREVLSILNPVS